MQTTLAPTIRDLRSTDAASLAALAQLLGSAETVDQWRQRLRGANLAIGAEQDGRLVGYATGAVRTAFSLEPAGWVETFGVANAWRGRGLGRSLAAALFARFREQGATRAYTVVAAHDRALAPFFRDVGFREEPLACLGTSL
jgi:ribosomal protein S18 acetylase RimI-like enzyme